MAGCCLYRVLEDSQATLPRSRLQLIATDWEFTIPPISLNRIHFIASFSLLLFIHLSSLHQAYGGLCPPSYKTMAHSNFLPPSRYQASSLSFPRACAQLAFASVTRLHLALIASRSRQLLGASRNPRAISLISLHYQSLLTH